jgi:uncharacterized phiE125 gp8 family phage protein
MSIQLVTDAKAQAVQALSNVDAALLTSLLQAASAFVEHYCDRSFLSAAYTETISGKGTHVLYLRQRPVTAITSVVITDSSGATETVPASDYALRAEAARLELLPYFVGIYGTFPPGRLNVAVAYTAGYAVGSIPDDLQEAVIQVTLQMHGLSNRKDAAIASETLGTYSVSYADLASGVAVTPLIAELLNPYKNFNAL